jgi:hypothetical protein
MRPKRWRAPQLWPNASHTWPDERHRETGNHIPTSCWIALGGLTIGANWLGYRKEFDPSSKQFRVVRAEQDLPQVHRGWLKVGHCGQSLVVRRGGMGLFRSRDCN